MTHCDDGVLRSLLEGDAPDAVRAATERHLAACAPCRARLAGLEADATWAGRMLATLPVVEEASVDRAAGWRRLRVLTASEGAAPVRSESLPRTRAGVVAALAAGVLAAGALAVVPPVRAAAAQLLSVFQVHTVQVVDVSPTEIAQMDAALKGVKGVNPATLVRITSGAPAAAQAVSLAQAAAGVPFPLAAPQTLAGGYALSGASLRPASALTFTLRTGAIDRLLSSLGEGQALPATLAGAAFTLQIPASVRLTYTAKGAGSVSILQAGNPTLSAPAGVGVGQVRQLLLGLPILPASLRAQLAAVGNWRQTALVPQLAGVSQAVMVGGAQGVFVQAPAMGAHGTASGRTALVWLANGVVHVVGGDLTLTQAQAVAAGLS